MDNTPALASGWAMPGASKKFHYFRGAGSLCGKWLYMGPRDESTKPETTARADDCKECFRRRQAELSPARPKIDSASERRADQAAEKKGGKP